MLYWMCKKSQGLPLTWPQMKHAIMRNFGGLKSPTLNPLQEFEKRLDSIPKAELLQKDYDSTVSIINAYSSSANARLL